MNAATIKALTPAQRRALSRCGTEIADAWEHNLRHAPDVFAHPGAGYDLSGSGDEALIDEVCEEHGIDRCVEEVSVMVHTFIYCAYLDRVSALERADGRARL